MSPRTYRRGLAGRVVETVVEFHRIDEETGDAGQAFAWSEMEEARLAALLAETGPLAWFARVEGAAGEVLASAGYRVERDRLGLVIVPDGKPLPDVNALDPLSCAARVVTYARATRIVLRGGDRLTAFEWGTRLMQAAQGLDLELAGWPLAAERGHKSWVGEDKSTDPEKRKRAQRWCDEVTAALAAGRHITAVEQEIASRDGAPFRTVQSAVRRERGRRGDRPAKKTNRRP